MFINHIFLYFSIIFLFLINKSKQEQKLRWAFEIFRHGARTPYSGMTKDFKDCFGQQWFGLKELTGIGLHQHFLVGYRNRIKYVYEYGLINEIYDPREIYLISTDSNRTIMSANAQVQGLFPPGSGPYIYPNQSNNSLPPVNKEIIEEENNKLDEMNYTALPNNINIIPIHSFFNADHFIQLQDKKVCPKTNEYYKKNQQRKEVVDFLNEMTNKYGDKLNEKLITSDKSKDVLKDYTKAYYIFDTIISEYTEGYDLPDLGVSDQELLNDSFKFFNLDLIGNGIDNDKDICLHAMSPIFDRILKWMSLKIEKDVNGDLNYSKYDLPKFVMFSAHDSTCAAFMGFMQEVFGTEMRYTYFAHNINLELYREETGNGINIDDYKVEYIINDESMLNISFVTFNETLIKRMKTMEEINEFCGFNEEDITIYNISYKDDEDDDKEKVYMWVDISLGILSAVLIGIIVTVVLMNKKNSNIDIKNIGDKSYDSASRPIP